MIFKKGDIVECRRPYGSGGGLEFGKVYVIKEFDIKNRIVLEGVEGGWMRERFIHTKNGIVKQILEDL